MRMCTATLRRAYARMRPPSQAMPGPAATTAGALAKDAIMRGPSSGPIEKLDPGLSRMSEQEFQAYKEKIGL